MITPKYIRDYMIQNYPNNYKISGKEFIMQSPFQKTWKRKFTMNLNNGLWRDFTIHDSGNFTKFVAMVYKIPYNEAQRKILLDACKKGELTLSQLNYQVQVADSIDPTKHDVLSLIDGKIEKVTLERKPNTYSYYEAQKFLKKRKLPNNLLWVVTGGKFSDRVIIPYLNNEKLYFFQARALLPNQFPKYLSPSLEKSGVKSSTILYPYDESKDHLVVCEGPVDAITLQLHNINATCTQGSYISSIQESILFGFKGDLIIGYDNDSAGHEAVEKIIKKFKKTMRPPLKFVYPLSQFKDWNEMHSSGYDLTKFLFSSVQIANTETKIMSQLCALMD